MKLLARIGVGIALVGIIALGAAAWLVGQAADGASSLKSAALNAAIDASGIKETVRDELDTHLGDIAALTGITLSEAQSAADALDIPSWTVADLPADASETATYSTTAAGFDAEVTLYDDPSYVTVQTQGHEVTFHVPETAQDYTGLIAALS